MTNGSQEAHPPSTPAGDYFFAGGPDRPLLVPHRWARSAVGIGDTDGALAATYRYDSFGVTVQADGPFAATNPWRYTGAYLDATGLCKLG